MKIKVITTKTEYSDVTIDELIKHIISEEGDYFLFYEDDDMLEEFASLAEDVGVDSEEIEANSGEILEKLKAIQGNISSNNMEECISEAVAFIETSFSDDFWDVCENPVTPRLEHRVFVEAIKRLYKENCVNEEVE